jgi:hypothetical protein
MGISIESAPCPHGGGRKLNTVSKCYSPEDRCSNRNNCRRDNDSRSGDAAHTLPMTRNESDEVFLYDIAILQRFRQLGARRMLVNSLREAARDVGINVVF